MTYLDAFWKEVSSLGVVLGSREGSTELFNNALARVGGLEKHFQGIPT
jgi:hypothetical protein